MQHSDFHHSWIVTILGHSLLSLRVCFSSLLVASWVSLTLFHGSWWVQSFLRFLLHTMGRSYRNGILSAIVTTTEIQGWMWQFSHIQPRSDGKKKKKTKTMSPIIVQKLHRRNSPLVFSRCSSLRDQMSLQETWALLVLYRLLKIETCNGNFRGDLFSFLTPCFY